VSRWFNAAAAEWVIFEAQGVPRELLSTLIMVALHADYDGRSAYPSASTVAELTRKSERQAKRDLDKLESLGLLSPGDRRVVLHIRADMRPNVYDLPAAGREYVGRHRKRGVTDVTPNGVSPTSPREANGVTSGAERGDITPQNGVSPTSPEEFFKNSGKGAPPPADGGAVGGGAPETQNPAMVALAAEPTHCADPRCRGSRFPVDPATGMHDECKGFARFRAVKIR
jgi:hypothetical protein